MPCHLDMARKGRNALKVLRDRKAVRLELPSTAKLRTETCAEEFCSTTVNYILDFTYYNNNKIEASPNT
jgi:hypothetical protein